MNKIGVTSTGHGDLAFFYEYLQTEPSVIRVNSNMGVAMGLADHIRRHKLNTKIVFQPAALTTTINIPLIPFSLHHLGSQEAAYYYYRTIEPMVRDYPEIIFGTFANTLWSTWTMEFDLHVMRLLRQAQAKAALAELPLGMPYFPHDPWGLEWFRAWFSLVKTAITEGHYLRFVESYPFQPYALLPHNHNIPHSTPPQKLISEVAYPKARHKGTLIARYRYYVDIMEKEWGLNVKNRVLIDDFGPAHHPVYNGITNVIKRYNENEHYGIASPSVTATWPSIRQVNAEDAFLKDLVWANEFAYADDAVLGFTFGAHDSTKIWHVYSDEFWMGLIASRKTKPPTPLPPLPTTGIMKRLKVSIQKASLVPTGL